MKVGELWTGLYADGATLIVGVEYGIELCRRRKLGINATKSNINIVEMEGESDWSGNINEGTLKVVREFCIFVCDDSSERRGGKLCSSRK